MSRDVQRLDVHFKDPSGTFKAGESVSGMVHLELGQELKLKGIKLYLLGIARVHWDEKRAYTKGSSAKLSHRNLDSYLDETYMVMSQDTLAPGRYSWPFSARLPLYLPASYDGQWGRVQYVAKLVLERPWKGDIELCKNFTVIGHLDLNTEPEAKKSAENVCEAMVGAGCCKSGPVMGHLALARRGFSVGQNIPFHASVDNKSKQKVNVRVVLSQQATFRADKQLRKNSTVVKVLTKGEVCAGQDLVWEDALRAVPAVPPTGLGGGCKTIDVKYSLTLIIAPSGSGRDIEVPVDVIIGSISLRGAAGGVDTHGSTHSIQAPPGLERGASGGKGASPRLLSPTGVK